MQIIRSIQNRIYEIRGERVMLDRDLAALYETETKALNLAVKRNIKRFPKDFMFQLTKEEFEGLRFQIETLEKSDNPLRLQNETLKTGRGQHSKYQPYAFTEQGVAMLSGILNSGKAINMNPEGICIGVKLIVIKIRSKSRRDLMLVENILKNFSACRRYAILSSYYSDSVPTARF